MQSPFFSVIVPIYNNQCFLNKCIDSLISQTFKDFEIILVDDGSTDKSGIICDEYAIEYNCISVIHKTNGGASSARNAGIELANGKWITFCDSDDYVYDDWLHNFYKQITNQPDIVCQGMVFDKNRNYGIEETTKHGFDYSGILRIGLIKLYESELVGYTFAKAFKKEIIYKYNIRFNPLFNYHEDEEFVLNYLQHCQTMSSCAEIGYHYNLSNWEKYDIRNRYLLFKNKYSYINYIFNGKNNFVLRSYLNDFVYNFFVSIDGQKSYFESLKTVSDFRKSTGWNILNAGIFCLTKIILFIDITSLISTWIIRLHISLKN